MTVQCSRFVGLQLIIRLLLVLVASLMTTAAWADVTLVKDGKPVAKIYVAGSLEVPDLNRNELRALSPEQRAQREAIETTAATVNDLVYHLNAMSGAELEVVSNADASAVKGPAIVFGDLAVQLGAQAKEDTVTNDAFRLLVKGDRVLLGGEGEVAASHATYHLLRGLGCDWLMPGEEGEVIPQRKTITIPDQDVAKSPAFLVRGPWYSGGRRVVTAEEVQAFEQWKRRQAQTHGRGDHPEMIRGGHFWNSLLRHNKKAFEEDPTMLPMVRQADGTYKYGKSQLEPTHPGVIDLTVEYIEKQFEDNNWPNDKAIAFSIGPNDGGGYSESPASMAAGAGRIDPITGEVDQTDVLIDYANKVIERLEDKYPNLKLGFYIYSVHADYPMKHKPHPKFVAHFADITYSRYHSLTDRGSYTRNYYRNILEQWRRLHEEQGNTMWFYGYNWNLAENLMPYTKLHIWGNDLPYYHDMGVVGHNNEQDKAWSILGPTITSWPGWAGT